MPSRSPKSNKVGFTPLLASSFGGLGLYSGLLQHRWRWRSSSLKLGKGHNAPNFTLEQSDKDLNLLDVEANSVTFLTYLAVVLYKLQPILDAIFGEPPALENTQSRQLLLKAYINQFIIFHNSTNPKFFNLESEDFPFPKHVKASALPSK